MRLKAAYLFCLVAGLALSGSALAQEGHPLVGTWYGDWGPTAAQRTQVTVVLNWDGKALTGTMDPGPDAMVIKNATLDSTKWAVHFEADTKDKSGAPVHIVAEGKLADIGSHNRTIAGSWTQGSTKGDFKLKRD